MSAPAHPLVSVIVPVAMGRAPYTRLFAWLPQIRDHNLEVILVLDEFSQVADPQFLSEISQYKSESFVLLRGSFGSPGGARNFGLKSAHGKWVTFWDSDDSPLLHSFLEMVKSADAQNTEIAIGSFIWRSELDSQVVKTFTNSLNFEELIFSIGRTPGIWRFAFKKDLIRQPFSTLRMAEDQEFILSNDFLSHAVFNSQESVYEYFTGGENHQTSVASNFNDLREALILSYTHFSTANNQNAFKLSSFFWLQQFGSSLKYGSKYLRLKSFFVGLNQFILSSFKFKKFQVKNLVKLLGKAKLANNHYSVVVPLTGGLGNQLFQLSAAMAMANGSPVGLDSSIGAPRLNPQGRPEIASFALPSNVFFLQSTKRGRLIQKSSGYLLRLGVAPRRFENSTVFLRFFEVLWNILIVLSYRRFIISTVGRGVGYFQLKKRGSKQLIYGYFQSYIWPEATYGRLQSIEPIDYSKEILNYRDLSEIEVPLVVHVRLGDYKLENNFGIPSKRYYTNAISQMWGTGQYKKIWVFSDEPNLALDYLPQEFHAEMRWIPEVDLSASHTLEVMRFGEGFVIGNSTFSWWGAFLAYTSQAQVIAPKPWFQFGDSPQALLPPGWKQIDAFED